MALRKIGVAFRILKRRDLAEEAAHDALLRIWRGARGFDSTRGSARSWIFAIVRNRALTILRDEGRFLPDDGEERVEPDFMTAVDRLPENSALRRCLEALDGNHRNAVVYSYGHLEK